MTTRCGAIKGIMFHTTADAIYYQEKYHNNVMIIN